MYCRKSPLTLEDVATLLKSIHTARLSIVKRGYVPAKIEVLLVYHLLFRILIESFCELQPHNLQPQLLANAKSLLDTLNKKPNKVRLDGFKIEYLEEVVGWLEG